MEDYNTEEEQVQAIKNWWKENAVSLIAGVVIGVVLLSGYKYWTENQKNQAQKASVIYSKILSTTEDKTKNTELLKSDFSATPYAALATLLLAKDNINANETDKAITQLEWVIDNSDSDGIQHLARQRLARVYISNDNIDAAEKLITGIKATGFETSYNEIHGDINLAKKLPLQAKSHYRLALSSLVQSDPRYAIIKMKFDDLTQASKAK